MPRAIQSVAGSLLRVAKHCMIKFFGIDPSPLDRALGRDCSQLLRGKVLQLAAIAAEGRASPADDGNISRFQHGFLDKSERKERFGTKITKLVSVAASERDLPQQGNRREKQ